MVKKDFGAGLRLSADNVEDHPAGPPQREGISQTERMFQVGSTLLSGILAINASQWIGSPLKFINPEYYDAYMAFTKQSFAVLTTTMTQWWAPTVVRVSGDESMHGQLEQLADGSLQCNFPERLVMMANHQLYTDWLYLWWIAYTNGMHGRIHIIMKESLKKIPFIGWGAQFYNFIFVARKWEQDKTRFQRHLQKLNNPQYPMWLIIFPEGTNLSAVTRETSRKWAEKNGLQDMKHQLLPRSTGLRFCLQNLRETTPWLYDCTIGYEGIPPGKFGQDIFTLRSSFFEGRPPKSVNMHWRRFRVADIPVDNDHAFEVWLRNRWREKDYMLEYFSRNGRFPTDQNWMLKQTHQKANGDHEHSKIKTEAADYIETQVKSKSWEEFLLIFAPIGAFVIVLFLFYSASQANERSSPLNDVPEEWKDVMGQASKLINSMAKLSDVQQGMDVAQQAANEEVEKAKGLVASKPNLRRAFSSSSTGASSQGGPKAKYRFVPNGNAKKPSKAVSEAGAEAQQKFIKLANGAVVPINASTAQLKAATQQKQTGEAPRVTQTITTSAGLKLKINPKESNAKAVQNLTSGEDLASTVVKPSDSISNAPTVRVKKAPVKAASVSGAPIGASPPKLASAKLTPIQRLEAKQAQKPTTSPAKQVVPVKKAAPMKKPLAARPKIQSVKAAASKPANAPKPATEPFPAKKQLANGMWVNTAPQKPVDKAPVKKAAPRQLANGLAIKS